VASAEAPGLRPGGPGCTPLLPPLPPPCPTLGSCSLLWRALALPPASALQALLGRVLRLGTLRQTDPPEGLWNAAGRPCCDWKKKKHKVGVAWHRGNLGWAWGLQRCATQQSALALREHGAS